METLTPTLKVAELAYAKNAGEGIESMMMVSSSLQFYQHHDMLVQYTAVTGNAPAQWGDSDSSGWQR